MTWGDPKGLARLHPAKTGLRWRARVRRGEECLGGQPGSGSQPVRYRRHVQHGGVRTSVGGAGSWKGCVDRHQVSIGLFLPRGRVSRKRLKRAWRGWDATRWTCTSTISQCRGYPSPRLMDLLADAVEAGKVKAVGVSNYSAEQMREAHAALAKRGIPLASNQVEYSLLHRQPESERRAGRLPRAGDHAHRLLPAGRRDV